MYYCNICGTRIKLKLEEQGKLSLKDNFLCSEYCRDIATRKKEDANSSRCKVCFKCFGKNVEHGTEYPYLCKNCELLAFKVDYEEEITEERYL